MDKNPWEVTEALKLDRILTFSEWIVDVWNSVAEDVNPARGDLFFGNWQPGGKAYTRLAARFDAEARSGKYPWLRVLDGSLQFTFGIDGVPLRIFRGSPRRPTRSAKGKGVKERIFQFEAFGADEVMNADLDWSWRVAVDPDPITFRIQHIWVLQVNTSGTKTEVRHVFEVPVEREIAKVTLVSEVRPEGVEFEPAALELQPVEVELVDPESSGGPSDGS